MTGRTHDLAGFAALSYIVAVNPPHEISLATAIVALGANFIGALAPDIDQPTADLWNRLPAGGVIGRVITPVLGGHRLISHSFIGIAIFGFVLKVFLSAAHTVLLVDMDIVWWAFMIGFISHLIIDMFSKEGVPWLFPLPLYFGIPPLKVLRMKTGGMIEKSIIFPLLMVITSIIYFKYYGTFLTILKTSLKW